MKRKDMKGWEESGLEFDQYCKPEEVISSDIYYYFIGSCPPAKQGQNWFLCGESYYFDGTHKRYMKFSRKGNTFFFDGYHTIRGGK